jgi:hypothetical protein
MLGDLYGAPAAGEDAAQEVDAAGLEPESHIVDLMDDIKSRLWFSYREVRHGTRVSPTPLNDTAARTAMNDSSVD